MTSKVTVETHGYPVLVEYLENQSNNPRGSWSAKESVQPFSKSEFTLHSGIQFKITELPQFPANEPKKIV